MAVNVRPEFYLQSEETNKKMTSMVINSVYPSSSNISSGIMSGDFIYNIETGPNQWLDLFKTHMVVRFTPAFVTAAESLHNYATCLWDRAQLYLDGKLVASSNNYTEDGALSRRLQFSAEYNKNINDMTYTAPGTAGTDGTVYATTVKASDIDHLDSLYLRTGSLIVPPNTSVRFVFTSSSTSNGILKSLVAADTGTAMTTSISAVYMNAYLMTNDVPMPENYNLVFITPDSFKSSISGTSLDIQHQTKANLVRIAAHFVSTAADSRTGTAVKTYSTPVFKYVTDESTTKCNTLYFKAGSQQIPQRQFDNSFGFQDTHAAFNELSDKSLDSAGGETRTEFLARGIVYSAPVVRSYGDQSKNIELHATFASAPAAYCFLTAWYEQVFSKTYDPSGIPLDSMKVV